MKTPLFFLLSFTFGSNNSIRTFHWEVTQPWEESRGSRSPPKDLKEVMGNQVDEDGRCKSWADER